MKNSISFSEFKNIIKSNVEHECYFHNYQESYKAISISCYCVYSYNCTTMKWYMKTNSGASGEGYTFMESDHASTIAFEESIK